MEQHTKCVKLEESDVTFHHRTVFPSLGLALLSNGSNANNSAEFIHKKVVFLLHSAIWSRGFPFYNLCNGI